jgi:hypothetical protein
MESQVHTLLTSELDVGKWSYSRPAQDGIVRNTHIFRGEL